MSEPLQFPDPVAGSKYPTSAVFACSSYDGGVGVGWIHVHGELDIATAPQLAHALSALQAHLVVLDLRRLAFMDSSGVHAIVEASARACALGRRLFLLRAPAHVDRMFALSGTADSVQIGDIAPAEPPVEALLQLATRDSAA